MADCCSNGKCTGHIPLEKIIEECDRLFNLEKKDELGDHLRFWRRRAVEMGDKKGELSLLSEMMGHYRMERDESRGIAAVRDGLALIDELQLSESAGAGIIYINAGTALQSFGYSDRALSCYKKAENCCRRNLKTGDERFAALFNNMASAYIDSGAFERAEQYYFQAAEILKSTRNLPDLAVTYVNLAQLYDALDPEDVKIEQYLDLAFACFDDESVPRDGYYAHTCRKCASAFGYFGRFMDEAELQKRAGDFYAGAGTV